MNNVPSLAYLKTILIYNKKTGSFMYSKSAHPRWQGKPAGMTCAHGYRRITINKRTMKVSNIVWLFETGTWPTLIVDHKDRNRQNDIFSNLRLATVLQNTVNANKRKDNTSGYKGVSFHKQTKKWTANIRINNRPVYLGTFDSAKKAHSVYARKAKEIHGEFAHV